MAGEIQAGNEDIWAEFTQQREQMVNVENEELVRIVDRGMQALAGTLLRMAAAMSLLEERGQDVAFVHPHLYHWLTQIADRRLLPEVVCLFSDRPSMLKTALRMPLRTQKALVDDEPIEVARVVNGELRTEMVPPSKLQSGDLPQVFDLANVRDVGAQRQWIESRQPRETATDAPERLPYEIKKGYFFVNRPSRFSKKELARILENMG